MADLSTIDIIGRGGRALILGAGKSGRAARARLTERGFVCLVADRAPGEDSSIVRDDDPAVLEGVDLVVKSPGVARDHPLVTAALASGVPLIGELELGWVLSTAPLHVITGSNGKSTATALLAHVFRTAGLDTAAAGNIGAPLSEVGPQVASEGALAVEASSFQIEDLVDFRCRAGAVLNVSPDHLDRHGTLDAYLAIKLKLLDHVESDGVRVLGADDPLLAEAAHAWRGRMPARTFLVSLRPHEGPRACLEGGGLVLSSGTRRVIARTHELVLDGPHNVSNALAVACLASSAGVDDETIATGFRTFRPLAHRLERIGRAGDVLFVNDSKATNIDALRMAIRSFEGRRLVLIAGGRDKGSPFEDLADLAAEHLSLVVLIGEAAPRIRSAWPRVDTATAETMDAAVRAAHARARPDGVVLLAPGCASFDMFEGFEDRGEAFRRSAGEIIRSEAR